MISTKSVTCEKLSDVMHNNGTCTEHQFDYFTDEFVYICSIVMY